MGVEHYIGGSEKYHENEFGKLHSQVSAKNSNFEAGNLS
jgi:hypothetical protein